MRANAIVMGAVMLISVAAAGPAATHAQTPARGAAVSDLTFMLRNGVSPTRVLRHATDACITFDMGDAVTAELRAAGANDALISGLRGVCRRLTPEEEAAQRSAAAEEERRRTAAAEDERRRAAAADEERRRAAAANEERRRAATAAELREAVATFSPAALSRVQQIGYQPSRRLIQHSFPGDTVIDNQPGVSYFAQTGGRGHLEARRQGFATVRGWSVTHRDVMIRFNIRYESGATNVGAGVELRRQSGDQRGTLRVLIDGATEGGLHYTISSNDSRNTPPLTSLVPWVVSPALRGGDNVVEVVATGGSVSVYINGTYVQSISGVPNIEGSRIDMFVSSVARYSFANFVAVALTPR
jgi:hypothetical protein